MFLQGVSLNSSKLQQSVRQWRPFANHNKANAFNVLAMNLSKLIIYHHYPWIRVDLFSSQKIIEKIDFIWQILTDSGIFEFLKHVLSFTHYKTESVRDTSVGS